MNSFTSELLRLKRKEINKLIKKVISTENKLRRHRAQANFDRRYSKLGQLSDACCKFDELKLELLNLNEKLNKLEEEYQKEIDTITINLPPH